MKEKRKMKDKPRVLIIIPAYNEEESICRVVNEIRENYSEYDYVVVNDGSKDNTVQVCIENGYNLLNLRINCGLTAAFQTGTKYAYKNGYDYAIQIDGDGQHQPKYIKDMVTCAEEKNADVVIGSRFVNQKKNHSMRMIGSRLITGLIKMTTGRRVSDPTSGMRLYNNRIIKAFSCKDSLRPEPDTISWLVKSGAKIEEIPVVMLDRQEGESYLNVTKSIKYMWKMCFSIAIVQQLRGRELM